MGKKVLFVATGGTISSEMDSSINGYVSKLNGEDIVSNINYDPNKLKIVNFKKINSPYIKPDDMLQLAQLLQDKLMDDDIVGAVVTHGTSTMEETSFFLDALLNSNKPVVLTGAQKTASEKWPDGPSNLNAAFKVAESPFAVNHGVLVEFANRIFVGRETRKIHSTALEAFSGGEIGFVYPDIVFIKEMPKTRVHINWPIANLPLVDIIPFYSGADQKFFLSALNGGASGIVVEGLGMGNVNLAYYEAIKDAINNDVLVVLTTRCFNGRVVPHYGYSGGGASLERLGVIFGSSLSSPKARILLMLCIAAGYKKEKIQDVFNRF